MKDKKAAMLTDEELDLVSGGLGDDAATEECPVCGEKAACVTVQVPADGAYVAQRMCRSCAEAYSRRNNGGILLLGNDGTNSLKGGRNGRFG